MMKHGDGVMDIAIEVDDVQKTYETVIKRGAKSVIDRIVQLRDSL